MPSDLPPVRVVDLTPEEEASYFVCLEDWPGADLAEAGDHKARWFRRMSGLGLKVKLALDADDRVGGMIQYLPIERSPAVGHGLEFILCVWVHGHAQGRGDFQGRGMGTALLEAAEADARERGARGMAAWGLALPFWMRASWFRRHGYRRADRRGMAALVWGGVVECRLVDTADRETMLAWGEADALFVDGQRVRTGPPPSEAKLAALLRKRVRRMHRSDAPA